MLEFKNVRYKYPDGTRVFEKLSFIISEGEFVYIIGSTGAGKSTMAKLISSEIVPESGTIMFYNLNVGRLRKRKIPLYRRQLGVVYQDFKLLPDKNCLENIIFVLEMMDRKKQECRARAREVLRMVNLADKANKFPKDLSGGEKQRLAIARAIANRPKLLICDEPTANLDPEMSEEIMNIIEKINRETGTAIIFITHNSTIVNERRKRTLVIGGGTIVADLKEGGYHLQNEQVREYIEKEEFEETQMLTGLLNGDLFIENLSEQQKDDLLIKLLKERKDEKQDG